MMFEISNNNNIATIATIHHKYLIVNPYTTEKFLKPK